MANQRISELTESTNHTGEEYVEVIVPPFIPGTNRKILTSLIGITKEFNRAWSETLVFDKNEIYFAMHELTEDVDYVIGSGNLSNQTSVIRQRFITDGTYALNFGVGFDYLYGITNGQILEAGNYEIYFLFVNDSVTVTLPGVSQQSSGLTQLLTPSTFAVVADGETDLDMSWTDVSNEVGYQIESSPNGTSGWVLYSNPAANATSDTETGLQPGETVYYRIKAVGDGTTFTDSPYSYASGTTENVGDVTAPVATFLPANATNVWPVNKPMVITFNEPIQKDDGTAVVSNEAGIIVLKETNSGGANIGHTWAIDVTKTIITVTPNTTLGTNQLVYLAVDGIEDVTGNEAAVQAITFTTTAYTFFNGSSHRLGFGDILDNIIAGADSNFDLQVALRNHSLSGTRRLTGKISTAPNSQISLYTSGASVLFAYYMTPYPRYRFIFWENVLTTADSLILLEYRGAIDTNNGLDRPTLKINGVTQTNEVIGAESGTLTDIINTTAQLSFGVGLNNAGTPIEAAYYSGEAKDMIIRSASGTVVELNVPVLRVGTDTSGNARHGTWAG